MTLEQKALLDKSQRSLDAAISLVEQKFYDFAVSRAYYAMFYVVEALLDKEGLAFSSHAAVISAFGQHLTRPGKVPAEPAVGVAQMIPIEALTSLVATAFCIAVNITSPDNDFPFSRYRFNRTASPPVIPVAD